jgi:hypothetical protein
MQLVAFRAATTSGGGTDTVPPSAPGNIAATATSSSQINVSWSAATDNVGVTAYLVERCSGSSCTGFTQGASVSGTAFNDTGLTASTSYQYRVRAADAADNLSPYSAIAAATTQAVSNPPPAIAFVQSKLRGTAAARWLNPTTGSSTRIGTFGNTGTQTFSPPGNNGTGYSDWVLVLEKQ